MTPQQMSNYHEEYSERLQEDEDFEDFSESRISNKFSEKIERKSPFISDSKNSKHSPMSSIKHNSMINAKELIEKYSPLKGEDELTTVTMEKIAKLKELSKGMFIMDENDPQTNRKSYINVEDRLNTNTKDSDFSTFRSELNTFGPADDILSSAKDLQPLPSNNFIS